MEAIIALKRRRECWIESQAALAVRCSEAPRWRLPSDSWRRGNPMFPRPGLPRDFFSPLHLMPVGFSTGAHRTALSRGCGSWFWFILAVLDICIQIFCFLSWFFRRGIFFLFRRKSEAERRYLK